MTKQEELLEQVESLILQKGLDETITDYVLGQMEVKSLHHFEEILEKSFFLQGEVRQAEDAIRMMKELESEAQETSAVASPKGKPQSTEATWVGPWQGVKRAMHQLASDFTLRTEQQALLLQPLGGASSVGAAKKVEISLRWDSHALEKEGLNMSLYRMNQTDLVLEWYSEVYWFSPVQIRLESDDEVLYEHILDVGETTGELVIKGEMLSWPLSKKLPTRISVRATELQ